MKKVMNKMDYGFKKHKKTNYIKKNIIILGEEWQIVEEDLKNNDGQCDHSVRKISIDKKLNREPKSDDLENLKRYKRKVLRHEIIHAIMEECGMSCNDEIVNERFVDWIAIMYPKMQKIFKELGIEEGY
jgi:hypothetical protein